MFAAGIQCGTDIVITVFIGTDRRTDTAYGIDMSVVKRINRDRFKTDLENDTYILTDREKKRAREKYR